VKRLFVLTPESKTDLLEILLDIAEDSPDAAERLRFEIYSGFGVSAGRRESDIIAKSFLTGDIAFGTSTRTWHATCGSRGRFRLSRWFTGRVTWRRSLTSEHLHSGARSG
jgi:hypothetical protein